MGSWLSLVSVDTKSPKVKMKTAVLSHSIYIQCMIFFFFFLGGGGVVVRRLVTVSYENKKYIFLNDKINIQCPDICRLFINLPKTKSCGKAKV